MIKKQSIWALTLFSLILVLSVYYITLPTEFEAKEESDIKTTIKEVDRNEVIETLKVENNENKNKKKKELQEILNKEDSTKEEKNNAYEELKALNIIKSKEEEIELKVKSKYDEAFEITVCTTFLGLMQSDVDILLERRQRYRTYWTGASGWRMDG